jgi:hypothetical protein
VDREQTSNGETDPPVKPASPLPITGAMSVESVLARVSAIEQAIADPSTLAGVNAASTGGTAAPIAPEPGGAGEGTSFAQALASASEAAAGGGAAGGASSQPYPGAPGTSALPQAGAASALPGSNAPYAAGGGIDGYPHAGTSGLATAAPGSSTLPTSPATGAHPTASALATSVYPTSPAIASMQAPAGALGAGAGTGGVGQQIVKIAESQIGQAEQPLGSNESPAIAMYRTATAGAIPGAPWCAYFASWVARQAGEPLGAHGEGLGAVQQVWSWAQSTGRAIPNGPGVVPRPGDLIVFGDEHVGIVRDVLPNGDIQTIEGNYENKVSANVRTPTEATGYVNMS